MKIIIYHWNNTQETEAIEAFCRWQNINYEIINTISEKTMAPTNGKGTPVAYEDDTVKAIGFYEFLNFIQKSGMVLS